MIITIIWWSSQQYQAKDCVESPVGLVQEFFFYSRSQWKKLHQYYRRRNKTAKNKCTEQIAENSLKIGTGMCDFSKF